MQKLRGLLRMHEISLLIFSLSLVVFSWPFFAGVLSGLLVVEYFFASWAVLIVLLSLFGRNYRGPASGDHERTEK